MTPLGIGMTVKANDVASDVLVGIGKNLGLFQKQATDATGAFDQLSGRTRDISTGRFVKTPQGILNPSFMREVGGVMKGVAVGLTVVGGAIDYALMASAKAAEDFGKGIAEVSTLVPEAQFHMEDMRQTIFAMSRQFGGDMKDQIKAMYQGISAGAADAASSTALLTQANMLAIGGVTDVKTAVDGLTNVLNAYGQSYTKGNLASLSDAFFVGLSKGKTTAAELAATLGGVAPSASAVGFAMTDLIAAISAITTKGINTAQAVTGIKAALAVISHPAKDAADEAKRLGIEFNEAAIRAKGFPAFLESITKNANYNADSMTKLFGGSIEAKNAMLALAGGGAAFNDTLDAMKKSTGATQAAFEKMSNTPAFQGQLFEGLKQQVMILIGEAVVPLKTYFLKAANAIMSAFTNLSKPFQKLIVWGIAAAGALATFLGGAIGAAVAIGGLIAMGKVVLIAFAAIVAITLPLIAGIAGLIAIGYALKAAWDQNLGGIATSVTIWFNRVKLAVEALGQLFSSGQLSGSVQEELSRAENSGIKQFAINMFMWFGRIKNFFAGVGAGFSKGLEAVGPVIEKIVSAIQRLIGHFSSTREAASSAKETFDKFGGAGTKVGAFIAKAFDFVARVILGFVNLVDGVVETVGSLQPVFSAVWDAGKEVFNVLGQIFSQLSGGNGSAQNTADTWRMIGQVLGWTASQILAGVVVAFRVIGGVLQWVGGIIGAAQTFFDGFINSIVLGIRFISAIFSGEWSSAWNIMGQIVDNIVNTIVQTLAKLVGGAAGAMDSLGKIFGKDLGLKASVTSFASSADAKSNLGTPLQAPGPSSAVTPGSSSPAVASAAGQAANTAAIQNALVARPPQPIEVNSKAVLILDGQQVAESVQKQQAQQVGRAFGPLPSPT